MCSITPPKPHRLCLRVFAGVVLGWSGVTLATVSCSRPQPAGPATVAAAVAQTSVSCRRCHEEIFKRWGPTDHALANRSASEKNTGQAFTADRQILDGGACFEPTTKENQLWMIQVQTDGMKSNRRVDFLLGAKPFWQPLVTAPGRRWQPTDMAFDVKKQEWFNVFGTENRQPGEWGHWTGRGMNWNSMCAACHMTGYQKNYDATTDSYASTWVEHGVGCIQCHGPMPSGHESLPPGAVGTVAPNPPFYGDRSKVMQTCAPCHARNEALTDSFQPGDAYDDHYRVVLPVNPAVYYPDGQQRDEDFNWGSVLLSRMGGHAGVTCMDCHDPHTTKTILPVENNQLCLQCHSAPGRQQPSGIRAPAIDPTAHSHHKDRSKGNSCVACHMPTTNYMQRAPRHDHGWLTPDPLMTKELGIPNACNRCHQDRTTDWAVRATEEWYGSRMEKRQRNRARAVAAAQSGNPGALAPLLGLLASEDVPAWRAAYLELSLPYATDPRVVETARKSLADDSAMVRANAVRVLGRAGTEHQPLLQPYLDDPVRLVRLEAAWALSPQLPMDSRTRHELDRSLALGRDQPIGRLRNAQDLANRGRLSEAETEMRKAVEWDSASAGLHEALAFVLHAQGKTREGTAAFAKAAELSGDDGGLALQVALACAESGDLTGAQKWLQTAVQRDPSLHRAWYNLGLLLAQRNMLGEAAAALRRAEEIAGDHAEYPYALATVLLRQRDHTGAREAALRALRLNPGLTPARTLLQSLPSQSEP